MADDAHYIYGVTVDIAPGVLTPIKPTAALYMMIKIEFDKIREITNDVEFCLRLYNEEAVLTIPGSAFMGKDSFRVVS